VPTAPPSPASTAASFPAGPSFDPSAAPSALLAPSAGPDATVEELLHPVTMVMPTTSALNLMALKHEVEASPRQRRSHD
jgi:hypothetical protein